MYNLLVVDDEEIAVKGIVQGIDWSDMPIANIWSAYDVAEAMLLFNEHKIHLLLSDIDMPEHTGIDLLKWVKEVSPETETIFLTGHADFGFAQKAIQLDSFDYLLKPIDHNRIKSTLLSAIEKIRTNEELLRFNKTYEHYYQQWNKQLPILVERFWQDVLNLRIPMTASHLANDYAVLSIPLAESDLVRLVLISVEQWNESLSARDEEIMTYAIKNAGEEMVLYGLSGAFVQESSGALYAVIYNGQPDSEQIVTDNCRKFIDSCKNYLHCEISCYVGEPVRVIELNDSMRKLSEIERNYLAQGGTIIMQKDYREESAVIAYQPNFEDWSALLEMGKKNELLHRVEDSFARMEKSQVDAHYLEGYYHGLVYTVFHALQKKSVAMSDVYRDGKWRDSAVIAKSLQRLREWALRFTEQAVDYMAANSRSYSHVIQRAIQYIEANLDSEIGREDIAGHVYLNSAYLSRLFKKETGQSLTDYILEVRISKVKPLLETTNMKISDIALAVGYDNFSHFTKMFKKATGLTPHEYRRKHQSIS